MHVRILPRRSPVRAVLAACLAFVVSADAASAQLLDARLPEPGRLWLELAPVFWNWSEQFALDSPIADTPDGAREPLFADLDGPIAARLFPGPAPLIADLNADAAALGFDPVTESDFSLGGLDFSTVNAERRTIDLGIEMGVLPRVAVGFRAPIVMTNVESRFTYDSLSATVTHGDLGLGAGNAFFTDARTALGSLQTLIDGGTLMGMELAEALTLRDQTDAYLTALEARAGAGRSIPTGPSAAGVQMTGRFAAFVAGFESLGIALPPLALPMTATAGDLPRWFSDEPVSGLLPRGRRRALTLGEFEVSLRIGLIDQITRRAPSPPRRPQGPVARGGPTDSLADRAARDSLGDPARPDSAGVPVGLDSEAADGGDGGLRLRTTVGFLFRTPGASASGLPYEEPTDFVGVPIGDGQRDVELSLFQDIALGRRIFVRAAARFGIQMADDLVLRVHPPDRPYAFASTETVVHRDLGDYVQLHLRPSIALNSAISVGIDYDYRRVSEGVYTIAEPLPDVPDASPLAIESAQTRHMVGLGVTYDISGARTREDLTVDRSPVRPPWLFDLSIRRSVSGSGGQTPAAFRYAASFRFPIGIF